MPPSVQPSAAATGPAFSIGADPGSTQLWIELYRGRIASELAQIHGLRPGTKRGDAVLDASVRVVEELFGQILRALHDQTSQLRADLASKDVSISALQQQLSASQLQVLEFHRTKKRGFIRSALRTVGALAVSIGGAVGGEIAAVHLQSNAPMAATIDLSSLDEVAAACAALDIAIDHEVRIAEESDVSANSQGRESRERETDDREEEPQLGPADLDTWFDVQDNEGGLAIGADISPAEGTIWQSKGFSPEEADDWHTVGMTPAEASSWASTGLEPFEADAWRRQEFQPQDAATWRSADLSPGRARDFRLAGISPDEAEGWHAAHFDPVDAARWLANGFDLEAAEHLRGWDLDPDDAAARVRSGELDLEE